MITKKKNNLLKIGVVALALFIGICAVVFPFLGTKNVVFASSSESDDLNNYWQVDYIESTGTQYIDTGLKVTNGMSAEFNLTIVSGNDCVVSGVVDGSTGARVYLLGHTNNMFYICYNDLQTYAVGSIIFDRNFTLKSTIGYPTSTLYYVETAQTLINYNTSNIALGNSNIYLFGCNINGNLAHGTSARLFSAKYYDSNGTLVRDYVPVVRIADQQIGLFDKVENKFYSNQGSSSFKCSGGVGSLDVNFSGYIHASTFWYNDNVLICFLNFTALSDMSFDNTWYAYPYNIQTGQVYATRVGLFNDHQSFYFTYAGNVCSDDWSTLGLCLTDNNTMYFIDSTEHYFETLGYNNGYDNGVTNGSKDGYNTGYDDGYKKGNLTGYSVGYDKGVNDAGNYTFTGLLSAVIDTPIKYFQSLFNFEFLGINLSAFLTGLFTLCVIVTIVKLCMGR